MDFESERHFTYKEQSMMGRQNRASVFLNNFD